MNKTLKYVIDDNRHILILFILAVFGYWQIAFLQNSVTWDMLDALLPWKYFAGECFKNEIFPFWDPFQQMGYPIHADLKTVLNPETLIIGNTIGYTNYTFHFLLILYFFLAGMGMYKLSFYLNKNKNAALLAGIAYMLCGYFVQQAQDVIRITGAAFIPFIIFYYLKIVQEHKYSDILKAAFFLFLMFTGGYQALTFILFYLLLIIFIYTIIVHFKEKKYTALFSIIKMHIFLVSLIILLSTVIIIIVYQVSPHLQRIGGLQLRQALFGAFSPQSCISFLLPFSVVKDSVFFDTDISMTNAFAGILILIFFIFSLFKKKNAIELILLVFGVFCLLASFGEYTPVREFLFRYVPLFNLFRFPSYFSLFMVIAVIILAANRIACFFEEKNEFNKKTLLIISGCMFVTICIFLVYSISQINFSEISFFQPYDNFFELLRRSTLHEHIFIHSLIQIVVISLFIFLLYKAKTVIAFRKKLAILITVEMLIAVQLNIYYTAVNEVNPSELHQYITSLPQGFPNPGKDIIVKNTDEAAGHFPLWRNTNNFIKKISPDGFNSFQLNSHETLYDSFPQLKQAVLNNTIIYLSGNVYSFVQIKDSLNPISDNKNIYVENDVLKNINISDLKVGKGDTAIVSSFNPNKIEAQTQNRYPCVITLLQSNYSGWNVTVNGNAVPVFTSNKLFISAILPPGKNNITFEYKNTPVFVGFLVSYITFGILCLILIFIKIREIRNGTKD